MEAHVFPSAQNSSFLPNFFMSADCSFIIIYLS